MKPLEFKCPKCRGTRLDEVVIGMTSYNEIEAVWPEARVEYNGESATDEDSGYVPSVRFQCLKCEYVLTTGSGVRVRTQQELMEWINFNCTFSIEAIREKLGVTERQALDIRAILFDLEPLQHEGKSISTAERHLFDEQLLRDRGKSDVTRKNAFVIEAVTSVCAGELPLQWHKWMTNAALASYSGTEHLLAYSLADKYYFWATIQDLHELEEQWKKNNS